MDSRTIDLLEQEGLLEEEPTLVPSKPVLEPSLVAKACWETSSLPGTFYKFSNEEFEMEVPEAMVEIPWQRRITATAKEARGWHAPWFGRQVVWEYAARYETGLVRKLYHTLVKISQLVAKYRGQGSPYSIWPRGMDSLVENIRTASYAAKRKIVNYLVAFYEEFKNGQKDMSPRAEAVMLSLGGCCPESWEPYLANKSYCQRAEEIGMPLSEVTYKLWQWMEGLPEVQNWETLGSSLWERGISPGMLLELGRPPCWRSREVRKGDLDFLEAAVKDTTGFSNQLGDYEYAEGKVNLAFVQQHGRVVADDGVRFACIDIVGHGSFADVRRFAEAFKPQAVRKALQNKHLKHLDTRFKVILAVVLGSRMDQVVTRAVKDGKSIHDLATVLNVSWLRHPEMLDFFLGHQETPYAVMGKVSLLWAEMTSALGTLKPTLKQVSEWLRENQGIEEYSACKAEYPHLAWGNFPKKELPVVAVAAAGVTCRRLTEKEECLAVNLGVLIMCCQKRGDHAASSMLAGLERVDTGFLAFERGTQLLAQSWFWETARQNKDGSMYKVLVLDSIELANNRDSSVILPVLRTLCATLPYGEIHMGTRYSKVDLTPFPKLEYSMRVSLTGYHKYTDYRPEEGDAVCLKRNGEVTF